MLGLRSNSAFSGSLVSVEGPIEYVVFLQVLAMEKIAEDPSKVVVIRLRLEAK